jgi:hypothetical protein
LPGPSQVWDQACFVEWTAWRLGGAPNLQPKQNSNIKLATKGPAIFMKPNLPSKKKFQMDAPSAEEQEKFDKLVV